MNPPTQRWDRETKSVAALAACVSVVAFLITYRSGAVLLYGDAVAHINIARRVFDSQTPGLLQLGTVWLPLPHLLMMPLVASNWAWQTGVGGSLPSMAAYVFGVVGLFRLVRGAVANSSAPAVACKRRGDLCRSHLRTESQSSLPAVHGDDRAAVSCAIHLDGRVLRGVRAGTESERLDEFSESDRCGSAARCSRRACLTRYDGWFLAATVGALGARDRVARGRSSRMAELLSCF